MSPCKDVDGHAGIFGIGVETVNSREIDEGEVAAADAVEFAEVLLDGNPGVIGDFWRRPVRRLKRVDLPEFGGPTSATVRILPEPEARP